MNEVRLALIGFGNVAQGLTQILLDQSKLFEQEHGLKLLITAITDPIKGNAFDPDGLLPADLLDSVQKTGSLHALPGSHPEWDAMEMIQNSPADVVVEMSYTNLHTGEPAKTYIAEALRRKRHVITTNKGPIALHWDELSAIAHQHGVEIGVEGTVMSGTPVLRVGRELLEAAGIRRIQGILNGTTNFILTQMERGCSYADALAKAQALGYAEADPTGDVEGYDTAAKIAILSRLVLHQTIPFTQIARRGISSLTQEDVAQARQAGSCWKLIGTVEIIDGQVQAAVRPECLAGNHPLARVSEAANAIVYTTDLLGEITIQGPGAGRLETGFAIIEDLFCIYRSKL